MNIITGYKWIRDDYRSSQGSEAPWEFGVWKDVRGDLELCQNGYHACRNPLHSLNYIYGNSRFVLVEAEDILYGADKFVARRMKLVKEIRPANEIMVRFAIACAKNVLYLFEQQFPADDRPRIAVYAAETAEVTAADYAARAAVYAADYAARTAARAAARTAARTAVYAAHAAVYAAAYAAAYAAERKWQERKLRQIIAKIE